MEDVLPVFPNNNDFESEFTFENSASPLPDELPFHCLLLGNWSGDTEKKRLAERRAIVIDRDNFEEVFRKLNVGLELEWQGSQAQPLSLHFSELDDFHPDNLFRNLTIFSELRDVRRRLSDPDTFDRAAGEVRSWFFKQDQKIDEIQLQIDDAPPVESGNLLDLILDDSTGNTASVKTQIAEDTELGRFVSEIVAPHLIRIDENEQSQLISAVDETISEIMRAILHHPKFQNLEAAWRGIYFLVRRVETDTDLKIFIFDITKDELAHDLKSVDSLADSVFYRVLVKEDAGMNNVEMFSAIGADFSFNLNIEDVAHLIRLGKIAAAAAAPFISYIKPENFGGFNHLASNESAPFQMPNDSEQGKLWSALRASNESGFIALSPTRIIARNPYGEATDATETFSFEEFNDESDHRHYLWMNPSFAVVLLLAQNYRVNGWQTNGHFFNEIKNLPVHYFKDHGETKTKPCAEFLLSESLLEKVLQLGLMPFISFRDSDKIRLVRLQSISDSDSKLGSRQKL